MTSTPAGARILVLSGGRTPILADSAWVAPGATLVGAVELGDRASVWYGAVLRAERARIVVGAASNLQDGVVVHVDAGFDATIGAGVSVGHNAVLHGCTIEDGALVGMNSTVLNGAVVGAGSLVAAGAVVLEGTVVPPGSLVAGVPATVRRALTEEERAGIARNAASYLAHTDDHRDAHAPG
ncbi:MULTISPECIES: gamma carbonic anhydrase family protein [unclassified Rathayibacter]|uniref:gamma carbonic anhydrase family protein n=1 Tax=unclassified Rathayibacter TaxID=2609250 RepID=UPI00188B8294|nr:MULTISPECIES: gamma carbonic anhydrase family protein [unclassified Rathayibacter]MBF4462237.1 gamma carbonic anhydrase family protein [Rathayibacter sp. VKM Ac-2879]MBF4503720.1 gamma carbonic anhydrase family protein [Rathayibacter sp. VKM Ac-2878]